MQPIAHPPEHGTGLSRMVGWSAGLHLALLTAVVVLDLVRPHPTVFRDVIRVDLVTPQAPAPEPVPDEPPPKPKLPPLKENPLWDKLAEVPPPAAPKSDKAALAEIWNKVSKTPPKAKPEKEPEDLKKWWAEKMRQDRQTPQATSPEQVKIPERKRLADAWKDINATLPEAVRITEAETQGASQGELADWWKRQMDMTMAPAKTRQASAASEIGTPQYRALVEQRVAARWSPPDIFRDRRAVTVILAFELMPDGRVRSVKVVRSSGSNFYDQAALRAIFLSDPFPAFPKEVEEPSLEIRMTFSLDRSRLG
jgi:colicin import membrane protein